MKFSIRLAIVCLSLTACRSTTILHTATGNKKLFSKTTTLTEEQKKDWSHTDLLKDTLPGMSVHKVYDELIGDKKGTQVIVAVIDEGIDLYHEDLKNVLWTNTGEVPNNNRDDDGNGYIDDIHGYNFLGESYPEQYEYVRMLRLKLGTIAQQADMKRILNKEVSKEQQEQRKYNRFLLRAYQADSVMKAVLKKEVYTVEDVKTVSGHRKQKKIVLRMFRYADTVAEAIRLIKEEIQYHQEKLAHKLNADFNGREAVGDDPYNINDTTYGNSNVQPRTLAESHGTHVAGIIAAERDNGCGMDGIANNVAIMSIRVVPNGDEYDKDVARGIRYAVDNGAKVINGSFRKSFSPYSAWVHDAIQYAASHDVLIVQAAGNEGLNLDNPDNPNFPNDQIGSEPEVSNNFIVVGASTFRLGPDIIAEFSNYGKVQVDIFAPGEDIYSTMPGNNYDFQSGTSMAAPAVAGLAALIRSYYPNLTAVQVKNIIMQSGLPIQITKSLSGITTSRNLLDKISKSGKIANAYQAMILANSIAHKNSDAN